MQFFPPLTSRSRACSEPRFSRGSHQPSSQIFFFLLSRSAMTTTKTQEREVNDGRRVETGEVQEGNGGGGGTREDDGRGGRIPREGNARYCSPAGHGDVISTTEPETYYNPAVLQPRSYSVPMYEWPILLGLSLGKSLSILITASVSLASG